MIWNNSDYSSCVWSNDRSIDSTYTLERRVLHLGASPGTTNDLSRPKMSTTEALRIQLDELRLEKQELEVQNRRLREEHADKAAVINLGKERDACRLERDAIAEENERLKNMYEQLLRDNQTNQQKAAKQREEDQSTIRRWEEKCAQLEEEMQHCREKAELEMYRAVEREKSKWEDREDRLVKQVNHLEDSLSM